jgi:hypothetical protein
MQNSSQGIDSKTRHATAPGSLATSVLCVTSNDVIRKAPGSATENHYQALNVKKHIFCLNQYGNKKNLKPLM